MNILNRSFPLVVLFASGLSLLLMTGCGSGDKKANAAAQASFDQAMQFVEQQQWEQAAAEFDQVLEQGVIGPDQAGELYAYRALALAHLGKWEESGESLQTALQGADLKMVEKVRAEIEKLK